MTVSAAPRPSRASRGRWIVGAVVALVILVAIATATKTSTPTAPAGGGTTSEVPWADYAADVRPRIDGLGSARDCLGLQAEFDHADANTNATMKRTGHNSAALLAYIDEKLQEANCY